MTSPDDGRGRNAVQLRRDNERLVLQILRRGGEASRAELARKTGLSNMAVCSIIQSLEAGSLVQSGARRVDAHGQPATLVRINPKGAFGIGVRLDRDGIETALIDFGGEILARRSHDGGLPSPEETLEMVRHDIAAVLDALDADERCRLAGIGVAQPFALGSALEQQALGCPSLRAWQDTDFGFELGEATGLTVFCENDGNAAAIAELFYGCGREFDDFVYLFVGSVIGCGVALDGDCLRGVSGNAGDIGVMPVPPSRLASAPACERRWELLLSRASLNTLVRHLRHWGETIDGHDDIRRHIKARHPAVEEWVDDCVEALTPALHSALCILDAPLAVIDADVDDGLVELILQRLASSLEASTPETRRAPRVIRGSFGADAGAIGAASLPMFFSFSPRTESIQTATRHQECSEHE